KGRLPDLTRRCLNMMTTNIKFYVGTLNVHIGEYQNKVRTLVVANSNTRAMAASEHAAASYYGGGTEPQEDGGYYANDAEVYTSVFGLHEIGLASFLELEQVLSVQKDENIAKDLSAEVLSSQGFKAFTASVVRALKNKEIAAPHGVV